MNDGNDWGAPVVTRLLGAPVALALVSVMIDGTRRRDRRGTRDDVPPFRDPAPPARQPSPGR